jgi:hypothetical protein
VPVRPPVVVPELGSVPVPFDVAADIERVVWACKQSGAEHDYLMRSALVGDRVLGLLCVMSGVKAGRSRREISDDLSKHMSNAAFCDEVRFLRRKWWVSAAVDEKGKAAADRFEAAWALYYMAAMDGERDDVSFSSLSDGFESWLAGARERSDLTRVESVSSVGSF